MLYVMNGDQLIHLLAFATKKRADPEQGSPGGIANGQKAACQADGSRPETRRAWGSGANGCAE